MSFLNWIAVIGLVYTLAVMWLSNRYYSYSFIVRLAPLFAPASYELLLILCEIRDASYMTFSRFADMLLLGVICYFAFWCARLEGK